jgi:GH24 family phage-related lysozyme (muramidase)
MKHIMTEAEKLSDKYPLDDRSLDTFLSWRIRAENLLKRTVKIKLSARQHEALISLLVDIVSNTVNGNGIEFESSLLLKSLNNREFQVASAEFSRFVFVGLRVNTTAWLKRDAEQKLFLS